MLRSIICASLLGFLLLALPATALPGATAQAQNEASPGTTTIVVVRHAEKAQDDPEDPSLSEAGERRAQALRAVLETTEVVALYSTQFRRTRETVEPLAQHFQLPVLERPVNMDDPQASARALASEILDAHEGKTVVVSGHSNTVPLLVEALSGRDVAAINEEEYDHLFLVMVPPNGAPRLFKTRYGEPSSENE